MSATQKQYELCILGLGFKQAEYESKQINHPTSQRGQAVREFIYEHMCLCVQLTSGSPHIARR